MLQIGGKYPAGYPRDKLLVTDALKNYEIICTKLYIKFRIDHISKLIMTSKLVVLRRYPFVVL